MHHLEYLSGAIQMISALGPKESESKSHPYKYSSSCTRSLSKKQDQIVSIIFLSGFRNTFWKCQTNAFYTWDKKTIRKHAAQNVSGLYLASFSIIKHYLKAWPELTVNMLLRQSVKQTSQLLYYSCNRSSCIMQMPRWRGTTSQPFLHKFYYVCCFYTTSSHNL